MSRDIPDARVERFRMSRDIPEHKGGAIPEVPGYPPAL